MTEQFPNINKYERALELQKAHIATSAFLGTDLLRIGCDGPQQPSLETTRVSQEQQTDEDRQYAQDVIEIISGKEQHGYRNR